MSAGSSVANSLHIDTDVFCNQSLVDDFVSKYGSSAGQDTSDNVILGIICYPHQVIAFRNAISFWLLMLYDQKADIVLLMKLGLLELFVNMRYHAYFSHCDMVKG